MTYSLCLSFSQGISAWHHQPAISMEELRKIAAVSIPEE
jgi:hypothetical protein